MPIPTLDFCYTLKQNWIWRQGALQAGGRGWQNFPTISKWEHYFWWLNISWTESNKCVKDSAQAEQLEQRSWTDSKEWVKGRAQANNNHKALTPLLKINPSWTSLKETPCEANKTVLPRLSYFTLNISKYTIQDLKDWRVSIDVWDSGGDQAVPPLSLAGSFPR